MKINAVFFCCTDGYPSHFNAGNTKCGLVAKGLVELGHNVLFINKIYGPYNNKEKGVDENGVSYVSFGACGSRLKTLYHNLVSSFSLIKSQYQKEQSNHLVIGCGNFFVLLPALIYARLLGYRVDYILEEWMIGMDFKGLYKVNAWLMSHIIGYGCSAILPISEFLKCKAQVFRKPLFKLPICADFDISANKNILPEKYLLYCAHAAYVDALFFVIDSYNLFAKEHPNTRLRLILGGSDEDVKIAVDKIKELSLEQKCDIRRKLPYNELMSFYASAQALLIPLFPDKITDVARFSQKISEYLSSRRPVISTPVGEIPVYFSNKENMYIAKNTDVESYSELMSYAIEHPGESTMIGQKGYELGKANFDYRILSQNLSEFMLSEEKTLHGPVN